MPSSSTYGIIGAMGVEIALLRKALTEVTVVSKGSLFTFHLGKARCSPAAPCGHCLVAAADVTAPANANTDTDAPANTNTDTDAPANTNTDADAPANANTDTDAPAADAPTADALAADVPVPGAETGSECCAAEVDVVLVASNVGQVYAAAVATMLITAFNVDAVLFSGVAGGLMGHHMVGDVILAADTINYDMDVTALVLPHKPDYVHKRGELPFLDGLRSFAADPVLLQLASDAAPQVLAPDAALHIGRVVTGSEFVTTARKNELRPLWEKLGSPLAVDMEAAAVGQICHAFGVPYLVVRALSDTMEGDAAADFNDFVNHAADSIAPLVLAVVLAHGGRAAARRESA
ncbi:5''''-methylthioadenosine nucleosidase [Thecamonas trahens ATCC 50062]|uniref:adenosylhomocysteine nucleosidase n=1 Tax=Thecamonas trahens ATCC 50062 TaxID=461836 RepID=A0A0L0DSZ4_THETB|nr:5''''-methylthioadenosine nucleosidase [Thecamonas trahens ATCC 50062]KNC55352.1 5''''-methylthioadenosine nucleosidase [Thecamonas trahens ATCC 50062]|eukprot:XP_013753069.1 5''''-methylthioadenosine nucleosidase [Thecamonas trahens ATCC 50062]